MRKFEKKRRPRVNSAMKMSTKFVLYVFIVVPCFFALSPTYVEAVERINWHTYDNGIALGKNEGKKIFLHFYANWCFYCRKMAKETFQDLSVITYLNDKFVSIRVDSDKNRRTASMYGVRALPSTWFLTEKGEKIGNIPGYLSSKQFLEVLKRLTSENKKTSGQGG